MFYIFSLMDRSLRTGRLATFAYFVLNGFLLGMWIVHIPAVEDRTGISHAVLGWLLLLLGAGAFGGMQLVGRLTDRFGARTVVPLSAALCSVALVLPGLAVNAWTLGLALLVTSGFAAIGITENHVSVSVHRARKALEAMRAKEDI